MSIGARSPLAARLMLVIPALAAASCGGHAGPGATVGLFPAPGSPAASPEAQITIRGAGPGQVHDLTVTGSRSGRHAGRVVALTRGIGTAFLPDARFDQGETVEVSLRNGTKAIHFRFAVAQPVPLGIQASPPGKPTRPGQVQSFRSAPDLHPPTVTVAAGSGAVAPGDIFLSPGNKLGQPGPLILDRRGSPIWFHPLAGRTQAFDFRQQRFDGKPVLTWWQGIVTTRGYGDGEDVIYDNSYRPLATVKAAEGYRADLHEFVITPQGTALITVYNPVRMNLSSLGGPRDGTVLDGVVQEIDIRTGLVLFEWHSLGNVALSESYAKPAGGGLFDYFHINSVALDSDGNLLVSARNTWAIYKINHLTARSCGAWAASERASGWGRDQFAYQHDARRQPDGTITLFDNGAEPNVDPSPGHSRSGSTRRR